jgi:hypothetical protein
MYDTSLNAELILKLLMQGGALSGIGGAIYWRLQKRLERRFAIELENTKNQLQLQHAKLSIVYEHQKDSFRKVLAAMTTVMKAIEDKIEDAGGPWGPIDSKVHERFRHAISSELLFLDGRAEHALEIFAVTIWDAVNDPRSDSYADSEDVSRAYEDLKLISNRVAEHFRTAVGLAPTSPDDPLIDVEILAACKLVTSWGKETHKPFARNKRKAEQLVVEARRNIEQLQAALSEIQKDIVSDPEKTSRLFMVLSRIERYSSSIRRYKCD